MPVFEGGIAMRRFLLVVLYSLLAGALFAPVQAAQATFLDEQYVVEQVVALLNPLRCISTCRAGRR